MKFFKAIANLFAFLAIPSLIFPHGMADIPTVVCSPDIQQHRRVLSYDDVLNLIDEIAEEEYLEERYTAEELAIIADLFAILAKHGVARENEAQRLAVERDIEIYLSSNTQLFCSYLPVLSDEVELLFCKNWFGKQYGSVKKFVHKHKTALIIGAAVVVAAVVIVVVVATAAPAVAMTSAAAVGAAATPEERDCSTPSVRNIEEFIGVATLLEEEIAPLQELALQECVAEVVQDPAVNWGQFTGISRDIGSSIAHKVLHEFDEIALEMAESKEKLRDLAIRILPDGWVSVDTGSPVQECMNWVEARHKYIDQLFGTQFTDRFLPQEEDEDAPQMAIGILPPQGAFGGFGIAARRGIGIFGELVTAERIPITQASSVVGWETGESINNLTITAREPKWSTVRQRYWKNRAHFPSEEDGTVEIERMKRGLAPQRVNPRTGEVESKELHHIPAQKDGGRFDVIEVWPDEHSRIDPNRYTGG